MRLLGAHIISAAPGAVEIGLALRPDLYNIMVSSTPVSPGPSQTTSQASPPKA